jgi:hypothetical protein
VVTTATTATTTYSASDASGVASYDLRYRRAGISGAFGGNTEWVTATRSTTAALFVAAGYRYCISVRARDTFGNVSPWSAERCIARPVDDRSLGAATTGWTRTTSSSYYMGTVTSATGNGAALTLGAVSAKQVHLLATKCSTCGSVAVYIESTKIGSASLYASTTANRALIALPLTLTRSGTLKPVVTSATGRLVRIDGVALRST